MLAAQSAPSAGPSSTIASSQSVTFNTPSTPAPGHRTQGIRRVVQEDEGVEDNSPEEDAVDELYCQMKTNVVGIQYYDGLVGPGEQVRLVREPSNKYDRNAIKVCNIAGAQIGHLPRQVAAKLAPLMDRNLVTVDGIMYDGNLSGGQQWSLSMSLKFYAPGNKRAQIEPLLIWATPGQRGFARPQTGPNVVHQVPGASQAPGTSGYGGSGGSTAYSPPSATQQRGLTAAQRAALEAQQAARRAAWEQQQEALRKAQELRSMLSSLERVDDEGRRSSLLDTLCGQEVEDVLGLPEHPGPPGKASGQLRVDLLKHQSQALQWCITKEYPTLPKKEADKPVQFWQYKKGTQKPFYFNLATKTPQVDAPLLGRGGLNADSMGLGKTLTMIALIMATQGDIVPEWSRSTLIVVPLSILSNWETQLKDHVVPGALTHCVYYGSSRNMTAKELQKYDVVITTYQTVTGEHPEPKKDGEPVKKKKKVTAAKGALFDVQWKRVILDEGHQIRNPKTKMARAVCALAAQRRWVLTGTPIINSPRDLGSILTFLRVCAPLDNEDMFKRLIIRPLKDGDPSGAELLRAVMSSICIHRTKEMKDKNGNHLVPLPPVEMTVIPVTLSPDARALYDEIESLSSKRLDSFMDEQGRISGAQAQSNVLSMLTRLRQLVLHPGLIPRDYLENLRYSAEHGGRDAPVANMNLTAQDRTRLQSMLAQMIEDNEECPICMGILNDPRITGCGHPFCLACITEVLARDPKCPMDRRPLGMGDLIEPPPPTELTQAPVRVDDDDEDDTAAGLRAGPSDKINQLIHLLQLTPSTEKSLVFSQFTSFLDKIGEALDEQGIPYVRFDGQMSARRRKETLEQFCVPMEEEDVPQVAPPTRSQSGSRRLRRRSSSVIDAIFADDDLNRDDSDFALSGTDDDGFLSDDEPKNKKAMGKSKARARTEDDIRVANPKVMLISLKAGALGLNLTVANNVYLWWQEGIESQAIDRCNRIGQKKPVHVYQLIAENTVESKVLEIQDRKKLLIKEAFSGIKGNETQRQKKEARLQDIIEIFGARRRGPNQQT
ncbi:hypothetical protein PUNSTDRAFT_111629 [Punctularia strigosozonata HHB-11173 SS5]|uniref:uncharacterized protein n=1 Tax=Punctularia strigosozonata (strain HHB-11173) TaxID=741275 RepID=UPI000441793A|nr:uncharacterized protein PUNSTDRAFT_111629 [Punctularia strigosozonata HHB-11173 SS5]EIN11511.1 hypothetical protein PUNSTDRAFT_111629 [Punctularia strigosozonata HHB-11173 SS5]